MSSLHCEVTFKRLHLSQHVHQSSVPLFVSVDLNQVITLTKHRIDCRKKLQTSEDQNSFQLIK